MSIATLLAVATGTGLSSTIAAGATVLAAAAASRPRLGPPGSVSPWPLFVKLTTFSLDKCSQRRVSLGRATGTSVVGCFRTALRTCLESRCPCAGLETIGLGCDANPSRAMRQAAKKGCLREKATLSLFGYYMACIHDRVANFTFCRGSRRDDTYLWQMLRTCFQHSLASR